MFCDRLYTIKQKCIIASYVGHGSHCMHELGPFLAFNGCRCYGCKPAHGFGLRRHSRASIRIDYCLSNGLTNLPFQESPGGSAWHKSLEAVISQSCTYQARLAMPALCTQVLRSLRSAENEDTLHSGRKLVGKKSETRSGLNLAHIKQLL